jgi:hypothetical protein
MLNLIYRHARLMEESEARVEMTAVYDSPADALVASRLLGHPQAYRRWEAEHDRLMRSVSAQSKLDRQVVALRSTALSLVHRKAMFEYLRKRGITGRMRHRFFTIFHGNRDYVNAVLIEHGNYVRCSSSYLCTQYLAEHLMEDLALDEPLQIYEQWYAEYFRAFCDGALAETEAEKLASAPMEALKPLLKHQLAEARQAILQMPQKPDKDWREVQIRKSTGDTQKLRVLFPVPGRVN